MQIYDLIDNNQQFSRELWEDSTGHLGKDIIIDCLFRMLLAGYTYRDDSFVPAPQPQRAEGMLRATAAAPPVFQHTPQWVTTAGTTTGGGITQPIAVDPAQDLTLEDLDRARNTLMAAQAPHPDHRVRTANNMW